MQTKEKVLQFFKDLAELARSQNKGATDGALCSSLMFDHSNFWRLIQDGVAENLEIRQAVGIGEYSVTGEPSSEENDLNFYTVTIEGEDGVFCCRFSKNQRTQCYEPIDRKLVVGEKAEMAEAA